MYSANAVPTIVESIVSLNVATTESSDFLLIFAVTGPDGVPDFLNLIFQDFSDFPINADDAFKASSPYRVDIGVSFLKAAALLPGIETS